MLFLRIFNYKNEEDVNLSKKKKAIWYYRIHLNNSIFKVT